MANSSGLNERPSRTFLRGVATLYQAPWSFHRLVLDLARVGDAAGGIEDLQRQEISLVVVVKDHAWLVLITLGDADALLQDDGQAVRPGVVGDLHGPSLQYFAILLVR